jgi:hypothetical protein
MLFSHLYNFLLGLGFEECSCFGLCFSLEHLLFVEPFSIFRLLSKSGFLRFFLLGSFFGFVLSFFGS